MKTKAIMRKGGQRTVQEREGRGRKKDVGKNGNGCLVC